MNRLFLSVASLTVIAAAALPASAAITSVAGMTTQIGSPASCVPGALSGMTAFAWDEQTNVPVVSLSTNMINNPCPNPGAAIPGFLTGTYDSHFIHFEGIPGVIGAMGSVTFSAPIDGVIYRNLDLSATDPVFGSFGTTYPTGYPFRDIGVNGSNFFSINGNVLTFNLSSFASVPAVVQLRVLTASVPSPGAACLAGLALASASRRRRRA